ncbi:MAG: insulinase family protein [Thermotogaceae bacterium]|nr:insulinase family protein [Thermotogaceae bacterium]
MIEKFKIGDIEVYKASVDFVESTSIAFVVRVGSVHENENELGASHFIEHVSFRGTKRYTMRELKLSVEKVGGSLNAFTSRLATVYYAKVPDFKSKETFDILHSIVSEPLIGEDSVELERKIIMEEYKMSLEDPDDRLYNLVLENVWGGPYGREIIGTEKTIKSLTAEDLRNYHDSKYVSSRVKVVVVGDTKEVEKVLNTLENFPRNGDVQDPPEPDFKRNEKPVYHEMKSLKHIHAFLIKEGAGRKSEDYLKYMIMNTMLGSGMSSYLFEEIREKLGTVYDIGSTTFALKGNGIFGIYFSTSPEFFDKTLKAVVGALRNFKVEKYMEYGIQRTLGKLILSLESPAGVLGYIIERLSSGCEVKEPSKIEEEIKSITLDELKDFYNKKFTDDWQLFTVVPEGSEVNIASVTI